MQIGIIATDGGTHPPEKVAMACATVMVVLDESLESGPRYLAALKLQLAVAEVLTRHHTQAQADTRAELAADAAAHFARTNLHDPTRYLDQAVTDVQATAVGTEWEPLFHGEDKVAGMRRHIGQYLVDLMHVERCWHADRHPEDAAAAAYKAAPAGVLLIAPAAMTRAREA